MNIVLINDSSHCFIILYTEEMEQAAFDHFLAIGMCCFAE